MYGIYINCKQYNFIDMIINGVKAYETRNRNVLRSLVGQRVALIETGRGDPTVRATATIKAAYTAPYDFRGFREHARIIGTTYDIKPGRTKVFYELSNVRRVKEYKLPAERTNHGRSWTEF